MPPFDQDLKDPKPDALQRTMATAVTTANGKARIGLMTPNPAEYARFATSEYPAAPEGVAIWLSDQGRVETFPPTPRATLLGVVWRTTPIGRQVRVVGRRIEPFAESPSHRFGPPWRKWPPLCLFEHDHVVMRTFAGGEPEAIATCECGAVGPPDKLGWMNGRCGPCHDHLEEEGTPLAKSDGPPVLRTEGQLLQLAWSPSGKSLAAVEWIASREPTVITGWDRATGERRSPIASKESSKTILPSKFPSGILLSAEYRGPLWIPESLAPANSFGRPDYGCVGYVVHGSTAATVEYDGSVWRRDLTADEAWTQCWPARRTPNQIYCTIALSPSGTKVALGRSESEVELLDWPGGEGITLRPPLEGERAERPRTRALAFSPDGKLLAAGSGVSGFVDDPREEWWGRGGGIYLYDAAKGQLLAQFAATNDDVMALAFSPDGSLLFSAATDCQLRVFDVTTRAEFAALGGHVGGVNALAFSPDGQTLASAGGDGLVRLWPWQRLLEKEQGKEKAPAKKDVPDVGAAKKKKR